jgi:uncharacterized 2Fe-2S/4Fe-4S cluster protein (DUF4445 family)
MTRQKLDPTSYLVDMEPVGRRTRITPGDSLLEAAQSAGVGLVSLCGGEGWCESCLIKVVEGRLSPPTFMEEDYIAAHDLAAGIRLACQAMPESDIKIDIPPESLTTPQRLQVEGQGIEVELDPLTNAVDLEIAPPSLQDLRSDVSRLKAALSEHGLTADHIPLPVLASLSTKLREMKWSARVVLSQGQVVALLPRQSRLLGLAVDIGTTKVAAYLLDLGSGETLARTGEMNPQIAYGEDVISRIAYTQEHDNGRQIMQGKLVEAIDAMASRLCAEAGLPVAHIVEAVVVGNTVMHHLFAGLPVEQLALAPYVPAVSDLLQIPAADIRLHLAPGANVTLLPNIAGYVGADHVAMILATDIWRSNKLTVAVDIGTNTEITLAANGRMLSCSCASGPAFEGAHIRDGMRAAPGAIERVKIIDGEVRTYTIDHELPVGLCGSGILDAVAEMRLAGIVDEKGAVQTSNALVHSDEGILPFVVLVPADKTGHGRDLTMNRKDVNEIQLAKAAIRTGLEILMAEAGIKPADIEDFIVAGAFGTYINITNAIRVGMFPDLPVERFRQVGNAAGMGARQVLLSKTQLRAATKVVQEIEYIELTTHPSFQDKFLETMYI